MNVFPGKMNKFLIENIGVLHNFLAIFQKIIVHPFQQIEFGIDCIFFWLLKLYVKHLLIL